MKDMHNDLNRLCDELGRLPEYASIGGYTIRYYIRDKISKENIGIICGSCATKFYKEPGWSDEVFYCETYDEGPTINCDHCNKEIESSYGNPE